MTPRSRSSGAFPKTLERISDSLAQVERAMREQLQSESNPVAVLGEHVLEAGGKRIRPALALLTAELCGYTGPRRVQVGAAVELLHTATLLHDDVVDCSQLRRGRPSANALWGNRRAILVGDFLYARASAMIVEDGDIDILWIFADTIRAMAEGELLQLERSFDPSVTEAHYYSVIDRKSAVLLSAACNAGAILGGVTRAERRRLATFGREVGLAFQLRDDALDYEAGEDALGKPSHTDLCEGKVTLPLLLTLKRCTASEREAVAAVLKAAARRAESEDSKAAERPRSEPASRRRASRRSGGGPLQDAALDLSPVLELVDRHRGVPDTVRRAQEHLGRALESIALFPDCGAKAALVDTAHFAVHRDR